MKQKRSAKVLMTTFIIVLAFHFEGVKAQELITIKNLSDIQSVLPDYSVAWSLPIQGNVVAIHSLDDAPFLYAVTDNLDKLTLLKISLSGKLVWEREWTKEKPDYYLNNLKVSDTGNLICVNRVNGSDESSQTKVFNGEGREIFHSASSHGFYCPSPGGNFLSYQRWNDYSPLEIYTPAGKPLALNSIPKSIGPETINRFIADGKLLVYDNRLQARFNLLQVPDGTLEWSYQLDNSPWFIDLSNRNTAYNNNYIAIQGTTKGIITLLDMRGYLQWCSKEYEGNKSLAFSTNDEYLLAAVWSADVVILDLNSGDEEFYVRVTNTNFGFPVDMDYHDRVLFVGNADTPYSLSKLLGTQRASYITKNISADVQQRYRYIGALETLYNPEERIYSVFTALQSSHSIERRTKDEDE